MYLGRSKILCTFDNSLLKSTRPDFPFGFISKIVLQAYNRVCDYLPAGTFTLLVAATSSCR